MIAKPLVLNGTPDWYACRRGMATASMFKAALTLDRAQKGIGETAIKYALKLAAERMGDEEDEPETWTMRRGSTLEPEALDEYQDYMTRSIEPQSIVFHDTLNVCGTPDGFVKDSEGKGIVECKCRTAAKHAWYIMNARPTDEDLWQIQGNLWLTGFDFCDFVSYRPLVPEHMRLLVLRIHRDEKIITDIAFRMPKFLELVDRYTAELGITNWRPHHLSLTA